MRQLLPSVLVVAAALALAGCSQQTPGEATSGEGSDRPPIPTGEPGAGEPTESPETSDVEDSGTGDLQPCDLLTSSEQAAFNLEAGAEEEIGPARSCQWQAPGQHTITVGVIDELGLDDVQSSGAKQSMTVGSHDAVQYVGVLDTCAISIGVTDTSRVDVLGGAGSDRNKACGVAKQAAELVETKLP